MNTIFQKVFNRISKFQHSALLASVAQPSDARGGKGPSNNDHSISWKPSSEFKLGDESDDEYVQIVFTSTLSDDDDAEDDKYFANAVIGIQALRKFPAKILSEEEQMIWSAVSWPSCLADVLKLSREMAKAKNELTIEAF